MRKFFILLSLLFFTYSNAYAYNYYIGPWTFERDIDTDEIISYAPPKGTVGLLDLRNLVDQGNYKGDGYGFFAVDGTLGVRYTLLGSGDLKSIPATTQMKDSVLAVYGYRPQGSTLMDLVWSLFTDGSDPKGETFVKPLMPSEDGYLRIHLGGHSLVKENKFIYGTHPHTQKVKEALQEDYRGLRTQNLLDGDNTYLKVLSVWGTKYKVDRPQDHFIPADLPKEDPVKPATTRTDTFNCANNDDLDCDLTWSMFDEVDADFDIDSNAIKFFDNASASNGVQSSARAEAALSSTDHYGQVTITAYAASTSTNAAYHAGFGPMIRFAGAAETGYIGWYLDTNADTYKIAKVVTGTYTQLSSVGATLSVPFDLYIEANGTSLDLKVDSVSKGTVTDSSISTGTLAGLWGQHSRWAGADTGDDFEAADLAAAAVALPQLIVNII